MVFVLDLFASFANHIPIPSDALLQRPLPPDSLRDDSAEDETGRETQSHRGPEEEGKQKHVHTHNQDTSLNIEGSDTSLPLHISQVEAAFTRHRQKMGRTAFLNVVRRKGVTAPLSPSSVEAETPSPEPRTSAKETSQGGIERAERCKPDGAAPKSPVEDGGGE